MEDNVSPEEKKERLAILQNRLNYHAFNIGRKMVGTIERCLVTGISKKNPGELQARTENNRVVNFPSSAKLIGEFVDIEIVDQLTNCLRGKIKTETNLCQN
jgi:tRNA-2-methylthio-N6-dimethylallyladenosine synthase